MVGFFISSLWSKSRRKRDLLEMSGRGACCLLIQGLSLVVPLKDAFQGRELACEILQLDKENPCATCTQFRLKNPPLLLLFKRKHTKVCCFRYETLRTGTLHPAFGVCQPGIGKGIFFKPFPMKTQAWHRLGNVCSFIRTSAGESVYICAKLN